MNGASGRERRPANGRYHDVLSMVLFRVIHLGFPAVLALTDLSWEGRADEVIALIVRHHVVTLAVGFALLSRSSRPLAAATRRRAGASTHRMAASTSTHKQRLRSPCPASDAARTLATARTSG